MEHTKIDGERRRQIDRSTEQEEPINPWTALIEELLLEKSEESRIRTLMEAAGLTYIEDPIERMNVVLQAMKN
jgi:hypothetical protein